MDQFSNHPLYRKHNIDSAMSSLWEFYKKKFLSLFIISLLMSLVLQYVSTLVNIKELSSVTDPVIALEKLKSLIVPILAISLISLLFNTILQYYILYNPVNNENTIFSSIGRSLKYFVPYLVIMILLAFAGTIAVALGVFVLIIGAFFAILYVATLYMFILPVMMVEGINIGSTITRSIKLAHKNFWSNLGWVSIFIIIMLVISVILSGIILLPFTGSFIKTIVSPDDTAKLADVTTKPLFIILSALMNALTLPVMPIFACILYFNGKAREEQNQMKVVLSQEENRVRVEDLYAKPYSDDHPDNPDNKK
jgi:Membrane domain of glycerophosphoryl diester phosphodiesterase